MTGLAHTAGSDVNRRFPGNLARPRCSIELVAMTNHTTGRQSLVITRAGRVFGTDRGHDQLNRALAVNAIGADYELRPVVSPDIGDETGILRGGVLQCCITAIGFRREGPLIAQWLFRRRIRIEVVKVGRLTDSNPDDRPRSGNYFEGSGCYCGFLYLRELAITRTAAAACDKRD